MRVSRKISKGLARRAARGVHVLNKRPASDHFYTTSNIESDVLIDSVGGNDIPIISYGSGSAGDTYLAGDAVLDLSAFGLGVGATYDKRNYVGNSFTDTEGTPFEENWDFPYPDLFDETNTPESYAYWTVNELNYRKLEAQRVGDLKQLYAKLHFESGVLQGMSEFLMYDSAVVDEAAVLDYIGYIERTITRDFESDEVGSTTPQNWLNSGTGSFEVKEKVDGTKYLECTSAGTNAFASTIAYGKWEFDAKRSDSSGYFIQFIAGDTLNSDDGERGYLIRLSSAGSLLLQSYNVGRNAIFSSGTEYTAENIWYRLRVIRDTDGLISVYIKGGVFGDNYQLVNTDSGSGTNPVINNIYKKSNYFVCDLDAGDAFDNISITGIFYENENV